MCVKWKVQFLGHTGYISVFNSHVGEWVAWDSTHAESSVGLHCLECTAVRSSTAATSHMGKQLVRMATGCKYKIHSRFGTLSIKNIYYLNNFKILH